LRHLIFKLCVFCIGSLPTFGVLAQNQNVELAENVVTSTQEELDTITVIAEPEPQTGDVQHEEYAGSHQHIDKQELQRHDVNLGDILANETGVQFRQVGGLGTLTTATVRGATSAQTGVFLDGIKLNSAGNSSIDLSLLELLSLSSVDIYRGSVPVQLSGASIGGAINLRSLNSDNVKPSTTTSFTRGSFNTSRFQLAHSSAHNRWNWVTALSREQSSNRFEIDNDNGTDLNPFDDKTEIRNNAQAAKISTLSRVGFQWNANVRSDVLLQATGRELGVPQWLNAKDNVATYDTDTHELQLVNRFDGLGNWNTSFSLFQHYQNNHYLDAFSQVSLDPQDLNGSSKTVGLKSYWERIGDQGTFSLNASVRQESLQIVDNRPDGLDFSVQRRSLLTSMQYAYFMNNERLLITPSIRIQTMRGHLNGFYSLSTGSGSDTTINPQLGLRFKKNKRLTLRATLGKFTRAPAFSELYGNSGLIKGNDKLLPEKGINADIGFTYSPTPAYQLKTSVFGSWRDELIVLEFNSQNIGQSTNAGKANIFGVEIANDWSINKQLSLRLNTTIQESQNFSPNPRLNKLPLPGDARLSSHAKIHYRASKTRFWFESNYRSNFFYDQANSLPIEGYLLHNAGLDHQWQNFSIGFTANNIGDKRIEDFNGLPRPGRSYYLSLTYRL